MNAGPAAPAATDLTDAPGEEAEAARPAGDAQSALDRIRGVRNEAITALPMEDFKFPSADGSGLVYVRCRPLDPDETKRLRNRYEKSRNPDKSWLNILDTIAAATVTVLVKDGKGKLRPLHEMLDEDEPYLFGAELAEQFAGSAHPGLADATGARQCIAALAGVERLGRLPVEYLYSQVMEWMADGITEVDEELLGE